MRSTLTIATWLATAAAASASQNMSVAVCNLSQVPVNMIKRAEAEASYVFRTVDIEIRWMDCGAEVGAQDTRSRPDFIVRIQTGGHVAKAGPASLEAMGRAFMESSEYGYMVDTYVGAINDLTLRFPFAGSDQLLGYVITHELGHLLIGPGHRQEGIMRASWSKPELEALNHRNLKFTERERCIIVEKLRARKEPFAPASVAAPKSH